MMRSFSFTTHLHEEHAEILAHFTELTHAAPKFREDLLRDFRYLVHQHMVLEERFLYPLLGGPAEGGELGIARHHVIQDSLLSLVHCQIDEEWYPALRKLRQVMEAHLSWEEEFLFREQDAAGIHEDCEDAVTTFSIPEVPAEP